MSATSTSVQLQCVAKGGPLETKTVAVPELKANQVLMRQRVVALNLLDCKQRDYGLVVSQWPYVLGIEGAGVIEAVGSDVVGFAVGDEVGARQAGALMGEDWGGAFQERVVVNWDEIFKRPKNISLADAASLPIGYSTAIRMIHGSLEVPLPFLPGASSKGKVPKSILILGGSSATGASAIQLLRLAYPSLPVFATSSPANARQVTSLGATQVFDYHRTDLVAQIVAASPDKKGIDAILDCVGSGASQTDICNAFDTDGLNKYIDLVTGIEVPVPSHVNKIVASGVDLTEMQGGNQMLLHLTKLVEDGKYKVPLPVKVIGHKLEDLPVVMDQIKEVSGAKLVVTLD